MLFARLLHIVLVLALAGPAAVAACKARDAGRTPLSLVFACVPGNDLYAALCRAGSAFARYNSASEAIERSPSGAAVLILADSDPAQRTSVPGAVLTRAREKGLRLYIEFPESVPGVTVGREKRAVWERVVVADSILCAALPRMRILSAHQYSFVPVSSDTPLLYMARVAGYDTAIYGLPEDSDTLLGQSDDGMLLVCGARLSWFVTGRFAPHREWLRLWEAILSKLASGQPVPAIHAAPLARPAYERMDSLPDDAEQTAFATFVQWYSQSRLLVHESRAGAVTAALAAGGEDADLPGESEPYGDGRLGILEGYASAIRPDGTQPQRLPLRADCNAEAAMVFALHESRTSAATARNLLDYVFLKSGMCGGKRDDPSHPAFGLIGWGAVHPAWTVANYGDDNARVLLAAIAASAALETNAWDTWVLRGLLANLRTTGKLGFREDRVDMGPLEQRGWKSYAGAENVNFSPHFESYLWACNLWAFARTGHRPFLDSTVNAIRLTMEHYPDGWRWGDTIERARMLLCLAWLVRVNDTPEHRKWLWRIADDVLQLQQPCGAIQERLAGAGGGHYLIPSSNEMYGTGETPLVQRDGDPASDQLYTTGFALLGLHEAAAATGDPRLKTAGDRLAQYACRIQVRSEALPWLNGCWFRAFDYRRWDYWASSADAGWGAWSVESGWGAAWTAATLALRCRGVSFWDFTQQSSIARLLPEVTAEMARNDGGPWRDGE